MLDDSQLPDDDRLDFDSDTPDPVLGAAPDIPEFVSRWHKAPPETSATIVETPQTRPAPRVYRRLTSDEIDEW